MIQDIIKDAEAKMEDALENTKNKFAGIRSGRANAGLFSGITVNYYGTATALMQLASVNVAENRVVIISPFDKSAIDGIVKSLQDSNLGFNSVREGDQIRVTLPELTEQRRLEYVKLAKTRTEEGKVFLRSLRHKAIDEIDQLLKNKEVGEDDHKRSKAEIDKLIKKFTDEIELLFSHKEKEILEV
ncbi:MAG: ribosome recycling factor [Candidatus Ancillula sp.]|jgi:ribosome recycling factor|nr:ribosome recycling factor [Candidatus Ancillula sp.]